MLTPTSSWYLGRALQLRDINKRFSKVETPLVSTPTAPVGRPVPPTQPAGAACVHHRHSSKPAAPPSASSSRPASTLSTTACSRTETPNAAASRSATARAAGGWELRILLREYSLQPRW